MTLNETVSVKPIIYQKFGRLFFLWNPKVVKSRKIDSKIIIKMEYFAIFVACSKKKK